MPRYLMTHSLLSSWLYAMRDNPYEDMTTERDPYADFLATLRREPTERTGAMAKGIVFEDQVTKITLGKGDAELPWYDAAARVADIVAGGLLQVKAQKTIRVGGMDLLLYGRLDALKAGVVYDIKYSGSYDVGKYYDSTQHPTYLELIPEAKAFTYLVSNGSAVWTETYRRDEVKSIIPVIEDFLAWLQQQELMQLYQEKWASK